MLKHGTFAMSIGLAVVALSYSGFSGAGTNVRLRAAAQAQHDHAVAPTSPSDQSPPSGKAGMMMHQQMMAEMKAADAKLDELVKSMDAATGEARVSAIALAVHELVRQQKAMHEHMGMMGQQMMGGKPMMKK